jgi:hypothetical protein
LYKNYLKKIFNFVLKLLNKYIFNAPRWGAIKIPIRVREVKKVRKVTIGIFSILTVFLVFLSTASNVTAAIHRENYIDLKSWVDPNPPGWATNITINDPPVNYRWNIRSVQSGDKVNLSVKCFYENNFDPAKIGLGYSGYHWYSIGTVYNSVPTWTNWSIETYAGQSGYNWIYHEVDPVYPFTTINVGWDVYVENYINDTDGEDDYDGFIDLTP